MMNGPAMIHPYLRSIFMAVCFLRSEVFQAKEMCCLVNMFFSTLSSPFPISPHDTPPNRGLTCFMTTDFVSKRGSRAAPSLCC